MTNATAPTTAAAVANAFLDIQAEDHGDFPRIDQMKLYKLVYYAHAWWLAQRDQNLFEEDVHAWPWGPVVPSLYGTFMAAGRGPISGLRATELVSSGMKVSVREPDAPDQDIMTYLRSVWDIHKSFSGVQLSNATHAAGEPWAIVREQYGDLSSKPLIPNPIIQRVFKQKIETQHAIAAG
ncbi:Panacea domain-containing protein [Octadecabacter ascidiaceicola]|uniref:Antitoxin SocA-like Panacea domain-containing protein n=1 Tax=Octadecabacter ascidiaceicola TaxID=1655543 RepID=A0A238JPU2_9RHOB|nr:type II toxin-antitoxin system antitoxin SocA domain-containing protein [Octadecabacter ascidiaceicola]SMX32671.1 hypothetical protein OCA8868_00793 [Octadecabacter ascidiaceicola]